MWKLCFPDEHSKRNQHSYPVRTPLFTEPQTPNYMNSGRCNSRKTIQRVRDGRLQNRVRKTKIPWPFKKLAICCWLERPKRNLLQHQFQLSPDRTHLQEGDWAPPPLLQKLWSCGFVAGRRKFREISHPLTPAAQGVYIFPTTFSETPPPSQTNCHGVHHSHHTGTPICSSSWFIFTDKWLFGTWNMQFVYLPWIWLP